MSQERKSLTAEDLSRVITVIEFAPKKIFNESDTGLFMNELAAIDGNTFAERAARFFGILEKKSFRLGAYVEIFALPYAHTYAEHNTVRRNLAAGYGYMVVVSGSGLYGAEIHFVERNSFALTAAIEHFSKLKALT